MSRLIVLLAVQLQRCSSRRKREAVVRRRRRHPRLYQRGHIDGNIRPCLAGGKDPGRTRQRRKRCAGDAVLAPAATDRLDADQSGRIETVDIEAEHGTRYLRRCRPRGQQAQVELHQARVAGAYVDVGEAAAVYRGAGGTYMSIGDQCNFGGHGMD